MCSRGEEELVAKQVWRVKLVAEFDAGETTEVEVARIERDEQAGLAGLGLRLAEAKQLTAAIESMRSCGVHYAASATASSSFAGRKPG